jgi:amino acid adenylation domain-containing protein
VLTDNHVSQIVAILGILKAGKFFTLLDANAPAQRNATIVNDAQARLIVASKTTHAAAEQIVFGDGSILDVDENTVGSAVAPNHQGGHADAYGYLLYTSGTTGQPKGVIQTQRNILHGVRRRIHGFHICPRDRLTLLSGATHQAVMNILSALLCGATICPFNARFATPEEFAAWLSRLEITIYHSSASLLRQLLHTSTSGFDLSNIRLVRSASESPAVDDVEQCRAFFPPTSVFANGLGSTETGTSTLYFIERETRITTPTVPIGYALEDMEILLLDDAGQPVDDIDRPGEIAIRSRYLAPGYWRRPELTEMKFRGASNQDDRVYLTGDLGRFTTDGALEHLGRTDFQVKIRGHRVDTADIEHHLRSHSEIAQAYVMGDESASGAVRLIGYLVARRGTQLTTSALRSYLRDKLPEPMIPTMFLYVDALPVNSAGKVDRAALPKAQDVRPDLDQPFTAARTPVEESLARIWSEVLSLDRVGIHDQFFDLGGHSIAATRVVSRVIDRFKIHVPIRSLFAAPTVAEMALLIEAHQVVPLSENELRDLLEQVEAMTDSEALAQLRDPAAMPK